MTGQRAIAIVLALVMGASIPATAEAAAPRLLMVTGPGLPAPVILTDWSEIGHFVQAVANESPAADRASLVGRPSLRLALFWDAAVWEPYIRQGRLASLRPRDASQIGRFYPARGGNAAAIDLPWTGQWPKQPNEQALAILKRHGVPIEQGVAGGGVAAGWWIAAAAAGSVIAAAAAGAILGGRTRATGGPL